MENAFSTSEKYYFCQNPNRCKQAAKLLWSIIYGEVFPWNFLFPLLSATFTFQKNLKIMIFSLFHSSTSDVTAFLFIYAWQFKSHSPLRRNFYLRLQMENEQMAFTSRDEWMLSSSDLWFIIEKLFPWNVYLCRLMI